MINQAAKKALTVIRKNEDYFSSKWRNIAQELNTEQSMAGKIVRTTKNEPELMRDVPTTRLLRYKNCLEVAVRAVQLNEKALRRTNGAWSLVPSPDLLYLLDTWPESPMVLQYDEVLSAILLKEPLDEDLIVDNLLTHLPFPSFFVEAKDLKFYSHRKNAYCEAEGFFVSEAWIPSENRPWDFQKWLSVVCVADNLCLPILIPANKETYGEVLKAVEEEAKSLFGNEKAAIEAQVKDTQTVLNLILYLGAEDAEVDKVEERPIKISERQEKGFHNKGNRPEEKYLTTFKVGKGVGEIIRRDENNTASGEERKMAAHIRRAHYHTYLEGSRKDGTLHPVVHWVEAIPVNMRKGDKAKDPIVRRVK